MKAILCAAVLLATTVLAVEVDMEKPKTLKPVIFGNVRPVMVPRGDPRAFPRNKRPGFSPVLRGTGGADLTAQQLVSCMPGLGLSKATQKLPFMVSAMKEAQITTCARTAAFLAQLGHESGSLVYMQEIASGAAYEGRRDLGNTQPGDGRRFKGRGPIQLTGRANYVAAGKALGMDLISNPTIVATDAVGFRTSAWFWTSHGLNALADSGDFQTITRRINGGTNGASDRNMRWAKCKAALQCGSSSTAPVTPTPVTPQPNPGAGITQFQECTSLGGVCQTAACGGVIVHNKCGPGLPTCCTPKKLQAAAPTSAACKAKKGTCQTSASCKGNVVRGLCSGPSTITCCVPKAQPPKPQPPKPQPPKPQPPKPSQPASGSSLSSSQLVRCMPGLTTAKANQALPYINKAQSEANINTCLRLSAWLAQLGHESGSLKWMEELASGQEYEGRRDLGNTHPGDGKRYKGRGPIQLTGRANYAAAGKALGLDLVNNPTTVASYSVGFRTSAWFWTTHGLNSYADKRDFNTITRRINGGTNGAADRNSRYATCKKVLGC